MSFVSFRHRQTQPNVHAWLHAQSIMKNSEEQELIQKPDTEKNPKAKLKAQCKTPFTDVAPSHC
jgi:hypothetical protein